MARRSPYHILHPGVARTHRISGPIRNRHIQFGTYRPVNRWRDERQILQRAQNFADLLPWLHKYNFARS